MEELVNLQSCTGLLQGSCHLSWALQGLFHLNWLHLERFPPSPVLPPDDCCFHNLDSFLPAHFHSNEQELQSKLRVLGRNPPGFMGYDFRNRILTFCRLR
jgi:hypothetical protein